VVVLVVLGGGGCGSIGVGEAALESEEVVLHAGGKSSGTAIPVGILSGYSR
jgi:hypothetical protein